MTNGFHLPGRAAWAGAAAALALGCAHAPRTEVTRAADALRCEDAGRALDARARSTAMDELRRSATYPLSLAATGAGWVTDAAIVIGAGVAATGLVCGPLLALEVAAEANGQATAECVLRVGGAVVATTHPGIGSGVYRATRSWRCPDFVPLAREVRAVASCHSARDAPGDRELAHHRLVQLRSDRGIWACLPSAERDAVDAAVAAALSPAAPPAAAVDEAPRENLLRTPFTARGHEPARARPRQRRAARTASSICRGARPASARRAPQLARPVR